MIPISDRASPGPDAAARAVSDIAASVADPADAIRHRADHDPATGVIAGAIPGAPAIHVVEVGLVEDGLVVVLNYPDAGSYVSQLGLGDLDVGADAYAGNTRAC
jgi:hypothetical protein